MVLYIVLSDESTSYQAQLTLIAHPPGVSLFTDNLQIYE
jgi:hypothetical protein